MNFPKEDNFVRQKKDEGVPCYPGLDGTFNLPLLQLRLEQKYLDEMREIKNMKNNNSGQLRNDELLSWVVQEQVGQNPNLNFK